MGDVLPTKFSVKTLAAIGNGSAGMFVNDKVF